MSGFFKSSGGTACSASALQRFAVSTLMSAMLSAGMLMPVSAAEGKAPEVYALEVPVGKITSTLLLDVANAGSRLVAVGQRGHIVYSDDQGKTWTQAKVPTRQLLTAVSCVDAQHCWAVGHDTQILSTTDGGSTWILQYEEIERESPLIDVWMENLQHGFAVGAYGTLLETSDGGSTWEDVADLLDNEDGAHLNSIIQVKDGGLLIAGEMGMLFRSTDNGQTWEALEPPYEGSLFGALALSQSRSLLVFGLRGTILRSTDFGDSWQQITLPSAGSEPFKFGLAGAASLPDGGIVIVGHGGSVAVSHDDGLTFSVVYEAGSRPLSSVVAGPDGQLLTVGQGGVLLVEPPMAGAVEQVEGAQ